MVRVIWRTRFRDSTYRALTAIRFENSADYGYFHKVKDLMTFRLYFNCPFQMKLYKNTNYFIFVMLQTYMLQTLLLVKLSFFFLIYNIFFVKEQFKQYY